MTLTSRSLWPLDLGDSAAAIATRMGIYAVVYALIILFARGRNGARLVLIFGLGVVGMLSLLAEPVAWLLTSPDVGGFFNALDGPLAIITVSRAAHVVAVAVAVVAMLLPDTRRYCSTTPGEER